MKQIIQCDCFIARESISPIEVFTGGEEDVKKEAHLPPKVRQFSRLGEAMEKPARNPLDRDFLQLLFLWNQFSKVEGRPFL